MIITISVTVRVEGLHHWIMAPARRYYLRNAHRHQFLLTATMKVGHEHREIEFHNAMDEVRKALRIIYPLQVDTECHDFGDHSCETIGINLLHFCPWIDRIEISEDGECAAQVSR